MQDGGDKRGARVKRLVERGRGLSSPAAHNRESHDVQEHDRDGIVSPRQEAELIGQLREVCHGEELDNVPVAKFTMER